MNVKTVNCYELKSGQNSLIFKMRLQRREFFRTTKLPNKLKKLEKIQKFKRKVKYFLLQPIFYSVDEYVSYWVFLSVIYHSAYFLISKSGFSISVMYGL